MLIITRYNELRLRITPIISIVLKRVDETVEWKAKNSSVITYPKACLPQATYRRRPITDAMLDACCILLVAHAQ
jgi:hypothetical protein